MGDVTNSLGASELSPQLPAEGLHPDLASYIDMGKLKLLETCGLDLSQSGMQNPLTFQRAMNCMAAREVSEWMRLIGNRASLPEGGRARQVNRRYGETD
jgi:hypothetical protein